MLAVKLAVKFGDASAKALLVSIVLDKQASTFQRGSAIEDLSAAKHEGFDTVLLTLLGDSAVASAALRGLATYDHPDTALRILEAFDNLDEFSKQDAVQTLCSRKPWAKALLDAVGAKNGVEKSAISAFAARQIANMNDSALVDQLQRVWGDIRPSDAEKAAQIKSFRSRLTAAAIQRANRVAGKALFEKECATCHRLFGRGAQIGPELSGAQRTNIDYLLENIVDPSAMISQDFQMEVIETEDGRVVSGLIAEEGENGVSIRTVNDKVVIPKSEIASRSTSPVSMMPDGVANKLTFEQLRDLIAYLSAPGPVAAK
jgi:putative heme-binding domain-containing protein